MKPTVNILLCIMTEGFVLSVYALHVEGSLPPGNPVRRIVSMLDSMNNKVVAEGKKEEELFNDYMCKAKDTEAMLSQSVDAANGKLPELETTLSKSVSQKDQLASDLAQHQTDRTAAQQAMNEADSIQEREAAQYATDEQSITDNIKVVTAAIAAISNGTKSSFLQTHSAQAFKKVIAQARDLIDTDRQDVLAFYSESEEGSEEYQPQSGEIKGILRHILEGMEKCLADMKEEEQETAKQHVELMTSKKKEVAALTEAIEKKTERKGFFAVQIVQLKDDFDDTKQNLETNQKFVADIQSDMKVKKSQRQRRVDLRAKELVAISDTIKALTSDQALGIFKKSIPRATPSFLQVEKAATLDKIRSSALGLIKHSRRPHSNPRLDFIALSVMGKKVGFSEVIKMINDMLSVMPKDQLSDNHKKELCLEDTGLLNDEKKHLQRSISDLDSVMEEAKQTLDAVNDDMISLKNGINALDKSVVDATESRKKEHLEYTDLLATNSAAKDLLNFAKNRWNKFYNPPPSKKEEERSEIADDFFQMSQTTDEEGASSPPEEYSKQSDGSSRIIFMINNIISDLDKEVSLAKEDEASAAEDYESLIADAKEKRTKDLLSLGDKQSAKAALGTALQKHKETGTSLSKSLNVAIESVKALEADCNWLLDNFDLRREARVDETESLKKVKAVLSGADYRFS